MLNSENYVFGDQEVALPAHLNFGKYMLNNLRKYSEDIALINADTEEALSYKQLTQYAISVSLKLHNLGVKPRDTVALGIEKRNEFIPIVLGIVFTGASFTPVNVDHGKAVLHHKLSITKPKYLICSDKFLELNQATIDSLSFIETIINIDKNPFPTKMNSHPEKSSEFNLFEPREVNGQSDVAIILYSSGTTGMPKGVKLSHTNCILNSSSDNICEQYNKIWIYGEWYHNYDIFTTFKYIRLGKTIVYNNQFELENIFKSIQKYKVEVAMLVPSSIILISKANNFEEYDLSSLKILYSRSSPLHEKTVNEVFKRLPTIRSIMQGYGMTEAGELTSESWGTKGPKAGSVGMASPGITLKVVDPVSREILGSNKKGEICLRGPALMVGYIGIEPEAYLDEDGFFKTGDLGFYDEDHYFFIVERIKELIVYDGYNIAPLELETVLQLHPAIVEVGVVGKPDETYGELPAAFIVKDKDSQLTEQDVMDYMKNEVSEYMQLRGGAYFIDKIPRNPRNKILRGQLRSMLKTK